MLSVGLSFGVLVVNPKYVLSGVLFSKDEVLHFPLFLTLVVYLFTTGNLLICSLPGLCRPR